MHVKEIVQEMNVEGKEEKDDVVVFVLMFMFSYDNVIHKTKQPPIF